MKPFAPTESTRFGIYAGTFGNAAGTDSNIGIAIDNEGDINAANYGFFVRSFGSATGTDSNAAIAIDNAGDVNAGVFGIYARTVGFATGAGSTAGVDISNSGDVVAGSVGVIMVSNHYSMLTNRGSITAGSLFAIDADGAATAVFNENDGVITGFVDLTDNADLFANEKGAPSRRG